MNETEFRELAAGAALHALTPADERRYRDALAAHPEWAAIADTDAEVASLLAAAAPPVQPSDHIRSALLSRITDTPQTPHGLDADAEASAVHGGPAAAVPPIADATPARAAGTRRTRILFALAACLALLVGVGAGAVAVNGYLTRPASVVALEEIQAAEDAEQATVTLEDGGTATAHWSASLGTAVLVADGIAALPQGEAYELWFVRGDTPVSAGLLTAAEDGEASAVLTGDMHEGDVIAVTIEQAGGSPTGQPTTDPVIVIPTA